MNSLRLKMPKPCTESWNEMNVVDGGKFCNQCNHIVIDFSRFTDSEIIEVLKSNPKTCAFILNSQMKGQLTTNPPVSTVMKKIAAFISGAIISTHSIAQIQTDQSVQKATPVVVATDYNDGKIPAYSTENDTATVIVRGKVVRGPLNRKVANATVSFRFEQDSTINLNSATTVKTDRNGNFELMMTKTEYTRLTSIVAHHYDQYGSVVPVAVSPVINFVIKIEKAWIGCPRF